MDSSGDAATGYLSGSTTWFAGVDGAGAACPIWAGLTAIADQGNALASLTMPSAPVTPPAVSIPSSGGHSTTNAVEFTNNATLPTWLSADSTGTWDGGNLTVTGTATIIANPVNDLPNIVVQNGGDLLVATQVAAIGNLTLASGATLDIGSNILFIDYGSGSSPLAAVDSAVAYGAGVGSDSDYGSIISSAVNTGTPGKYAIGYADHTEIASVPAGDVEIRYTLNGDANLDGHVDILDYQAMAPNYDVAGTYDWSQGDFNHDGNVDILDYQALAPNYDTTLATPPTPASPSATVTYILSINDDGTGNYAANSYAIYAADNSGSANLGLANFSVNFTGYDVASITTGTGSSAVTVSTPQLMAPVATALTHAGHAYAVGFSANNALTANGVTAAQPTGAASSEVLCFGVGQTAGSLAGAIAARGLNINSPGGILASSGDVSWGTAIDGYANAALLVQGTYTGSALAFAAADNYDTALIFTDNTGDLAWANVALDVVAVPLATPTLTPQAGWGINATPGQPFSGAVADFTDTAADAGNFTAGNYSASINWGDGNTTAGTVVSDGNGGWEVDGNYTYAAAGLFNASVTIWASDSRVATSQCQADVSTISASGQTIAATQGQFFTDTLATFTDASGNIDPTRYTADIDWLGNGTSVPGTVAYDSVNQDFTVTGTNNIASGGSLYPVVTITDTANNSFATADGEVDVA